MKSRRYYMIGDTSSNGSADDGLDRGQHRNNYERQMSRACVHCINITIYYVAHSVTSCHDKFI